VGLVRRAASLSIVALLVIVPTLAAAQASSPPSKPAGSTFLWATVDVCESTSISDVVGVRGSMPGTGKAREEMFMRFRLQYKSANGAWRYVGPAADSGLVTAGSALYVRRQVGQDFHLATSTAAGTLLRGVVTFEWRQGADIVRRALRYTSAGHRPGAGAIPPGYSAAQCTIS
jgi:hypothetical protein